MAQPTAEILGAEVLHVVVSRFRDAQDVIPRVQELPYPELVRLLAPQRPPVRLDLVREAGRQEALLADVAAAAVEGRQPRRRLAGHPWFRGLEKLAWTAGGPAAAREAIERRVAELRDGIRRRMKLRLPCWSPAIYEPGATRGAAGVVAVSCLVLDYDDGTSITEGIRPWSDWPLMVHTSWSHTPEHPRFRVVLVLDEPVPVDVWPKAWAWAHEHSGGHIDPACKDPSRLYVLPAVAGPEAAYTALDHDPGGHLLRIDWETLPGVAEPKVASPSSKARTRTSSRPASPAHRRARRLLCTDRGARERAAAWLGAKVSARRAEHISCPACGRPSVWFWLEPGAQSTAQCNHRNSCGWWGHLDELLAARGGSDVG